MPACIMRFDHERVKDPLLRAQAIENKKNAPSGFENIVAEAKQCLADSKGRQTSEWDKYVELLAKL